MLQELIELLDKEGFGLSVAAIIGPAILFYIYSVLTRDKVFDVPKYITTGQSQNPGESKFDSLDEIMQENYTKDKNHIYKLEHPHKDVVIMPAKYVDELKAAPDDRVNFLEDINEVGHSTFSVTHSSLEIQHDQS